MDKDTNSKTKAHKGGTNPQGFDRIVREVFAPIYPVIAQQIVAKTLITSGRCLDAGCGTGALGRAIAAITNLHVTFFDQSSEMLELAKSYANNENIGDRSTFVEGDIHDIPLSSDSIDLAISRGSSHFWDDWHRAYSEIIRVLKKRWTCIYWRWFWYKRVKRKNSYTYEQRKSKLEKFI